MQLRAWCAHSRHVVVGLYIDYESDGAERWPERARLLTDAARKLFDMVLVWSLDCFNARAWARPRSTSSASSSMA